MQAAKFQGVVAKFQLQLSELLAVIESSETHFVRCIKPNMQKHPALWEDDIVTKQLRCAGVMEAVRVIAAAEGCFTGSVKSTLTIFTKALRSSAAVHRMLLASQAYDITVGRRLCFDVTGTSAGVDLVLDSG